MWQWWKEMYPNIKRMTYLGVSRQSGKPGLIDRPMKRWLQIATDDVDAHYMIGVGDARAVATSNIVPLVVPCALTVVVVELVVMAGQGLGINWERTPVPPRLCCGTPMEGTDMDVDAELMQKFSCMGTTDKDVLISEFQRLLGFQLNPAGCAFFLDMTNWWVRGCGGLLSDSNLTLT